MWIIFKKEVNHFFTNYIGSIIIVLYLIINGFILFINPSTNIFDFGYANLDTYFNDAPFLLSILVPCITMKSFSEEYTNQTFQILQVLPLRSIDIVAGKFLGSFCIFGLAMLPTFFYPIAVNYLSSVGGIDWGAIITSYVGLFLLGALFTAIGIYISSFFKNVLISFMLTIVCCFIFFYGFNIFSFILFKDNTIVYYIERIGIQSHYLSMQRGYFLSSDIIYFLATIYLFIYLTNYKIKFEHKEY